MPGTQKNRPFFDQRPVGETRSEGQYPQHLQLQHRKRVEDLLAGCKKLFDKYQVPEYISLNIRRAVESTIVNTRSKAPSEMFEGIRSYGFNYADLDSWSRANLGNNSEAFMYKVQEIEGDFKQIWLNVMW